MNTPTHMILSYAVLRGQALQKSDHFWIIFGGFLPDLLIFILPIYGLLAGHTMGEVWTTLYFTDMWQNMIDCFNSLPILAVVALGALAFKWRGGLLICASMTLHILGDVFLHNDDAHRHLFPLSDYRFESPISYWDPAHHGFLGGSIEIAILTIVTIYLWHKVTSKKWRVPLSSISFSPSLLTFISPSLSPLGKY